VVHQNFFGGKSIPQLQIEVVEKDSRLGDQILGKPNPQRIDEARGPLRAIGGGVLNNVKTSTIEINRD